MLYSFNHVLQRAGCIFALLLFWAVVVAGPTDARAAQYTLTWDESSENEVTGYKVHYGTSSGNYDQVVDVGDVTEKVITNLTGNTVYFFSVTSYSAGEESGYSFEATNHLDMAGDDVDGDGITNADEIAIYKTNPNSNDSDGDGVKDYDEVVTYKTDPFNSDTDGDGLSDPNEVNYYKTNPCSADTDSDGLSDKQEMQFWGGNFSTDYDGDGLNNMNDPDSDGDFVSDGEEIAQGTNPAVDDNPIPLMYSVNCGGPTYINQKGIVYEADTNFSSGSAYISEYDVEDTDEPGLFETGREGDFSYSFNVAAGNYIVMLHVADTAAFYKNINVFDVTVNGAKMLKSLDAVEKRGFKGPLKLSFPVQAKNGKINLDFSSINGVAHVSALQIYQTEGVYALNAGGEEFVDSNNELYIGESNYSDGVELETLVDIGNTVDDTLYTSERFGQFRYDIPIPNGDYIVTLKFAENLFNGVDKRNFKVFVEYETALAGYDIFKEAGIYKAHDVNVAVRVLDGELNIVFPETFCKVNALRVAVDKNPNRNIQLGSGKICDMNRDDALDLVDFETLRKAWNSEAGYKNWNSAADLSQDGKVDIEDLEILRGYWLVRDQP